MVMAPFRYKARILPDGHLPVPEEFHPKAGQELEVSITFSEDTNGEAEALRRADHLLRRWAGVGRGSGTGVAGSHDDHLYRR
jgi:hypothetical protein